MFGGDTGRLAPFRYNTGSYFVSVPKRRYEAAFVSKLNDSEGEAAETQVWIQYAVECEYLDRDVAREFYSEYDAVLGMLVNMISRANEWTLK